MIHKRLIRPDRVRQVPPSFSWVDQRFVRYNYISRCDCHALGLYLFLITVSDAEGLSYYSQKALCRYLKFEPDQLERARAQLQQAQLIAYQKPLYQVLALEDPPTPAQPPPERSSQTQSVGEILRRALQGGAA